MARRPEVCIHLISGNPELTSKWTTSVTRSSSIFPCIFTPLGRRLVCGYAYHTFTRKLLQANSILVDAHTALHLYNKCLRGDLMTGRTVILVSHHIHLCASSASYIVALDNGSVRFQGNQAEFFSSDAFKTLGQSEVESDGKEDVLSDNHKPAEDLGEADHEVIPPELATLSDSEVKPEAKPTPRKFVEEEKRAVGAISKGVWWTYLNACGSMVYWAIFLSSMALAAAGPVLEAGWLKYAPGSPTFAFTHSYPYFCALEYGLARTWKRTIRRMRCIISLYILL